MDNQPTSERDADMERVKAACMALGEHFDTVQIFATRHEFGVERGTVNVCYGTGNWFARYGLVIDWIEREAESTRTKVRHEEE